ncbi:NAD-dependent epimerase/dehydratase family protein, partial [Roseomonas chloroacetimidivorans]|uniref:NAD-dependent epimerase/dehydratase family protein n=1 Tax=Roseomonas chloroacetimidivorans TaxID=1766656 RepID=UPI003C766415
MVPSSPTRTAASPVFAISLTHSEKSCPMRVVVTGGAGFIGSALVRHLVLNLGHEVLVIDKLTYAGDRRTLA